MARQPIRLPGIKTSKRDVPASASIPVTADNFIRAETDKTFDGMTNAVRN